METTDNSLTWLLMNLLERTPGTRHALVLSRDGLKLCWTDHLTVDQADQLAAICSGIHALAQGASVEFGDGTGGVRHSMTQFHGGHLFLVEAGQGAHLAVIAEESADPGVVGHQMTELVEQIGDHLRAEPRASVTRGCLGVIHKPVDIGGPDRLYTITGGRSEADDAFDLVTLIVSECEPTAGMQSEHTRILEMCRHPMALVEISAELKLPITVVRILLGDLHAMGKVSARHPRAAASVAALSETALLQEVLHGLRNL